jgi:threonine/homoserine/homoserine lactone efflux protein
MDAFISTIVTLIQIVLAGFIAWGAWLAFRSSLAPAKPVEAASRVQADDFERVASLVLLALLCTALMPLAG